MKRRDFISTLGGAAAWTAVWPDLLFAQQNPRPRVGLIPLGSPDSTNDWALVDAFLRGLRDLGLINSLNSTSRWRG